MSGSHTPVEPIAIVGMACRFPDAPDLAAYWRLLEEGRQVVSEGEPGSGVGRVGELFPDATAAGDACRFGAYLDDIDQFDPAFFRISPVEAQVMDPQQRMMLETSWRAVEDAGLNPETLAGSRTGVYTGTSNPEYRQLVLESSEPVEAAFGLYASIGTSLHGVSGRVAYVLGVAGPSMVVDAACASSLVTVHLAATALRRGEADIALAGGAHAVLDRRLFEQRAVSGMLSPDGRCKAFDAGANGFVRGEGCGVVVLKRLGAAEADGDRIWGVVRGSAVNHVGASVGLTVPDGPAQEQVIEQALRQAGLAPAEVDYLEAHGTGTEVGDPIELEAAAAVYGRKRDPERPLLIGSVKTNMGHLEPAAGIAGLIKTVLAMRREWVPKHLHFNNPNPRVDWERIPLRVVAEAERWPRHPGRPARAGVSAYGMSGTNAHVVVEGYGEPAGEGSGVEHWVSGAALTVPAPIPEPAAEVASQEEIRPRRTTRLLPLSGKTETALGELAERYLAWLGDGDGQAAPGADPLEALADMAWTAAVGRQHHAHRAAVPFQDADSLRERLRELADAPPVQRPAAVKKTAFVYTGQGSQWPGMGAALHANEPVARAVLDRCDAVYREAHGSSLLDAMFGRAGTEGQLDRTARSAPALYAIECALAAQWSSLGVRPDVVLGHSMGEVAAAHAAGVFSLEDGMRFAMARGSLLGATETGAMAAVFAPADRVLAAIEKLNAESDGPGLSLAADNGTHRVVSGAVPDIEAITERFESEGVNVKRLRTVQAFHSALLEPALDDLQAALDGVEIAAPSIDYVSNVTGRVLEPGQKPDGAYWRRHARQPVAFARGIQTLAELGVDMVVEIGPRPVLGPLTSLVWPEPAAGAQAAPVVLSSLPGTPEEGTPADAGFVEAVGKAYAAGLEVSLAGLFAGEERRRVAVPGYPLQRHRHWIATGKRRRSGAGHALLGARHESPAGELMFETELSAADPPWLTDHRVFGRVVVPGALYGAMAASAALAEGSGAVVVEDLQLHSPLILPEDDEGADAGDAGRPVQLVLDADDGARARRVAIYSKKNGKGWTLHVEARLSRGGVPEAGASVDLDRLRAGMAAQDIAALYSAKSEAGIDFGPAFRGLQAVWSAPGEALGEIAVPPEVDRQGLEVHPLLIDGCFQLLSAARGAAPEGPPVTYMPFGWERLWLGGPLPDRIVCHVRLGEEVGGADGGAAAPAELATAELRLYDPRGAALGGIHGFTVKRATRAVLAAAMEGVDDLLYEVVWRERPLAGGAQAADFLLASAALAGRVNAFEAYLSEAAVSGAERRALENALGRLAWSYTLAALEKLGWKRTAGAAVEAGQLCRELGILPEHRRLSGRLLGMLSDAGILEAQPDGYVVAVGEDDALPHACLGDPEEHAAQLSAQHPHGAVELGVVRRCGGGLADVLTGRARALDLLFGGEPNVGDLYKQGVANRAWGKLLGDAVAEAVAGLPEGRRLRIVEVGGGTGSATGWILPKLPSGRFDYTFTDISAGFFADAEARFGKSGESVEFKVLDIEAEPAEQGFEPHACDLVIAANVLHATRDLGTTLANCRELLAPSGQLLALESLCGESWRDIVFGLLPDWWRFADDYRPHHALASPEVWRRALGDAGFVDPRVMGHEATDDPIRPAHGLVLARGPAVVAEPPGVWVLACDRVGHAAGLAAQLAERNQTVVVAGATDAGAAAPTERPGVVHAAVEAQRRDSWRALLEGLPGDAPLRGIVHLGALDGRGLSATTEQLKEDVTAAAGSALALVQGCLDANVEPAQGVWFVTCGAQALERERGGQLAGATLWGLGKVVAREAATLQPRMIDLDPAGDALPPDLINELLFADRENHVAHRAGSRLAARLVRGKDGAQRLALPEETGCRVRDDRTYLITGGLGGIGGAVAEWLTDQGARAIVLNGRRAPGAEAEAGIRALRERGVTAQVELADLADPSDVQAMLSRIDADLPPLGGVFHSVGELADAALENQSWDRFERLLWPKVLGAWELHRATQGRDLDLFVLFSSMAGVRGNPGQSNYAAANAFLDQLAGRRRALGLPGQVVQWGTWLRVGEAAEAAKDRGRIADSLAASGSGWFTPQQGIEALDRVVRQDLTSTAVASIDWQVYADVLPDRPLFLEELLAADEEESATAPDAGNDLLSAIRGASQAEREESLVAFLQGLLQTVLRLPSAPSPTTRFFDLGMDSLMAVELRTRMNQAFAGEYVVPNTAVFDHPDAAGLARHLAGEIAAAADTAEAAPPPKPGPKPDVQVAPRPRRRDDNAVAIVGMACRFPGAADPAAFWKLLEAGEDAVANGRDGTDAWTGCVGDPAAQDAFSRRGGFVDALDRFDAGFFGLAPIEARNMDPQQRLLLETSWQALEDAGMAPGSLGGSRTGVYFGIALSEYRDLMTATGNGGGAFGNCGSIAVGRVAFLLGLQGPAMPVDLACASALVAVHQGAAAIRQGETELALAGGVNAVLSPASTRSFAAMGMLSPDGRCRAFDADADGYVRGEGCGVVVLKRLGRAEADGDRIWGVIRGSAVNQNGFGADLLAPSGAAQQRVIEDALAQAGVSPADVDYLEAHGIGSKLGDPIEVEAAAAAYGKGRDAGHPLLIGSVKTNIGHLESASGIAGLIKVLLAMRRRAIPRQLNFRTASPLVEWDRLPVRVVTETTPWPGHAERPSIAAVSAFGLSGTNAHAIVEGYQPEDAAGARWLAPGPARKVTVPAPPSVAGLELPQEGRAERRARMLPLSGKSDAALVELAQRYLSWLDRDAGQSGSDEEAAAALADMAWTAGAGRSHFDHRAAVVFHDTESLRGGLQAVRAARGPGVTRAPRKVAFTYDGDGGEWLAAAGTLHETEPLARAVLDRCADVFRDATGGSLLDTMSDVGGADAGSANAAPALYALQCALTALWGGVGIGPAAVVGHGAGMLAAARAAGALGLDDGMRLAIAGSAAGTDTALAEPSAPLISGATGRVVDDPDAALQGVGGSGPAGDEATRQDCSEALAALAVDVVVEIGGGSAAEGFAAAVAGAWEAGLDVTFSGLFAGEARRRIGLPTYPFQRRRHWVEIRQSSSPPAV